MTGMVGLTNLFAIPCSMPATFLIQANRGIFATNSAPVLAGPSFTTGHSSSSTTKDCVSVRASRTVFPCRTPTRTMGFCQTLRSGLFSWELTPGPHCCWRSIHCRMVRNSAADWRCHDFPAATHPRRLRNLSHRQNTGLKRSIFRPLLDRHWSNDGAEPQYSGARFPGPKRKPRSLHHAKLAAFLLLRSTERG